MLLNNKIKIINIKNYIYNIYMTNIYLLLSSLLVLLPLSFFYLKTNKNNYEYILANLLIINMILSLLFWSNPI